MPAHGTDFGQVMADAGNDVTMCHRARNRGGHPRPAPQCRSSAVRRQAARQHDRHGRPAQAVKDADIIVVAIAAQFARVALAEFKGRIPDTAVVVSLMKGIERNTKKRMDEVVLEPPPAG